MIFTDNTMFPDNDGLPGELKPAVVTNDEGDVVQIDFRESRIRRPLICQATALSNTHVVLFHTYFGKLNTVYDDDTIFEINRKYLLQLLFLMKAYKREKAYFVVSMSKHIISNTFRALLRDNFEKDQQVFKPWFDYKTTTLRTLILKAKTPIKNAIFRAVYNLQYEILQDIEDVRSLDQRGTPSDWRRDWFREDVNEQNYREIYDYCINILDERYNELIRDWGGRNIGQRLLDNINTMDITELYQLEFWDQIFTTNRLQNLIRGIQADINLEFPNTTVDLNVSSTAKLAVESAFTQSFRDMKRGTILRQEDNQYFVQWEVPEDTRMANNNRNLNVMTEETVDTLRIKNAQAASFLISKIARKSGDLKFQDSSIDFKKQLRNGTPNIKMLDVIMSKIKSETVIMELDLTDGRLNECFQQFIDPMIQLMSEFNIRNCRGGGRRREETIVAGVNSIMRQLDTYFNKREDNCATRFARVDYIIRDP